LDNTTQFGGRPAAAFPPFTSCKTLDLPSVNLWAVQSCLTKNPLAIIPPNLCGIALDKTPESFLSEKDGRFCFELYFVLSDFDFSSARFSLRSGGRAHIGPGRRGQRDYSFQRDSMSRIQAYTSIP
jgi:hypothetical protein